MRSIRALLPLVAMVVIAPIASAQQTDRSQQTNRTNFENSWFWGAYAGIYSNATRKEGAFEAPTFGGEWLITHKVVGLYLSLDQSFFNNKTGYAFVPVTDTTFMLDSATLKDLRRFSAQFFAFPRAFGALHPYLGGGISTSWIRQAKTGSYAPATAKSTTTFAGTAGLQIALSKLSVYGQVTWLPQNQTFYFNQRDGFVGQAGIRLNIANAISNDW